MVKKEIKVSILQMASVLGDVDKNIDKVRKIIDDQLPSDSNLLVLPEVWTCGWDCGGFIKTAQSLDDSSVIKFLSGVAKSYRINIIGGSFITKSEEKYYNTCPVINSKGELVEIYNKNHLYSYYGCDEGKYISKGDFPVMVNLDGINFGLTICYDIRFPEIYRQYAKSGADVLVNCAAWGSKKPIPWEVMTKSRAVENQCYMIALTQCGHIKDDEYNLGQSRIIDYKGEELAFIKDEEGIVSAVLEFESMYEFRSKCTVLKDIKDSYEVKILCGN